MYDDNRFAGAARAWWLLNFFGMSNIAVLNGGLAAWRAAGFRVTQTAIAPVNCTITLSGGDSEQCVTMANVGAAGPLVDARETERY